MQWHRSLAVVSFALYLISLSLVALFISLLKYVTSTSDTQPSHQSPWLMHCHSLFHQKLPSNSGILQELEWLYEISSGNIQKTVGFLTQLLRSPFVDLWRNET